MCVFDVVFHHVCGHAVLRVQRCDYYRMCPADFERMDFDYLLDSPCHQCRLSTPQQIPPSLLGRMRFYFFRKYIRTQWRIREDEEDVARAELEDYFLSRAGTASKHHPEEREDPDVDSLMQPVDPDTLTGELGVCGVCGDQFDVANPEGLVEHPVRLPCHRLHIFGHLCIREWLSKNPTCPICRAKFEDQRAPDHHPPHARPLPAFDDPELIAATDELIQREHARQRDMNRRLRGLAHDLGLSLYVFENIHSEDTTVGRTDSLVEIPHGQGPMTFFADLPHSSQVKYSWSPTLNWEGQVTAVIPRGVRVTYREKDDSPRAVFQATLLLPITVN